MASPYGTFCSLEDETRKRTVPDRVLIKRVYHYIKAHRRNLMIGVSATFLGALTGLAAPYMHAIAIDSIILPRDLSGFLWWIPLFVVIILGNYAFQYVQTYQMRIMGERAVAGMRDDMMEKLQVISLRYFSEGEVGRIISRPTSDANTVRIFLRLGFTNILVDLSSILGAFVIMFLLDLRLALLAISILPIAVALVWFLGKYSRTAYRRTLATASGLTARLQEDLTGMRVTQAFAREDAAEKKFLKTQAENVKAANRAILVSTSYVPFVISLRLAGTFIILFFGALSVLNGTLSLGVLVAFMEYQFSYFMPLVDLVQMYDQYQSAMSAIERMFDLIDTKIEVIDPPVERRIELP